MSKVIFKIKLYIFSKIPEILQMHVGSSELGLLQSVTLDEKDSLKIQMQWLSNIYSTTLVKEMQMKILLVYHFSPISLSNPESFKTHYADKAQGKQAGWWECIFSKNS